MKRIITSKLDEWRTKRNRKPLLLQGTRQVGKTYSLQKFGEDFFSKYHYVNFEEREQFISVFASDLNPQRIIQDLSLELNQSINLQNDFLILDEVQQCPRALTSLKYFAENMPELAICAAGSLLGVHLGESSFPVGKVDELHMFPLTFEEFLWNGPNIILYEIFKSVDEETVFTETLHAKLWEEFKLYLVTGGLPEVVGAFMLNRNNKLAAFQEVRTIQTHLVSQYIADMAKHCGKQNAMHLERLWRNVPAQLSREQNGSSSKFVFKNTIPGIKGYERLAGTIDWLTAAGLIIRLPIVNSGELPFAAYEKENCFKLFVFDVGILGALSRLPVTSILKYNYGTYKGYYAENFIIQELLIPHHNQLACWSERRAEVEFLCEVDGAVIPVEVKSGWVTQAKSLRIFTNKYHPPYCVIFSARNLSMNQSTEKYNYPLYLASRFPLKKQ